MSLLHDQNGLLAPKWLFGICREGPKYGRVSGARDDHRMRTRTGIESQLACDLAMDKSLNFTKL